VLVIGREGQLARSLAEVEKPDGLELVLAGRPTIDLAAPATIPAAVDRFAPDVVVNAAAYTAVDKAESEPELAHAVNAEGPEILARACARRGATLIHVSTDYVFDGTKRDPYVESDPVAPIGVYGRSKLEGERRVAAACPRHFILRTAWVFSAYGTNFLKTMLRLAASHPAVNVVDDQRGNPTYAPHLAAAIVKIVQALQPGGSSAAAHGVYHVAGSGDVTWCGLAREIFLQSSRLGGPSAEVRPITTAQYPTKARRPANSRLDCSKLGRAFGIEMPIWRSGVEQCVSLLTSRAGAGR
jgi:dTDP-4-dehydrorhamnose reductase